MAVISSFPKAIYHSSIFLWYLSLSARNKIQRPLLLRTKINKINKRQAYAHGGVGFVITVLTDNNNRASADVKTVMNKQKLKPAESVTFFPCCCPSAIFLFPLVLFSLFIVDHVFYWKRHFLKTTKSPLVFWLNLLSSVVCFVLPC